MIDFFRPHYFYLKLIPALLCFLRCIYLYAEWKTEEQISRIKGLDLYEKKKMKSEIGYPILKKSYKFSIGIILLSFIYRNSENYIFPD